MEDRNEVKLVTQSYLKGVHSSGNTCCGQVLIMVVT